MTEEKSKKKTVRAIPSVLVSRMPPDLWQQFKAMPGGASANVIKAMTVYLAGQKRDCEGCTCGSDTTNMVAE